MLALLKSESSTSYLSKKVYLSRYDKLKIDSKSEHFLNHHKISFISLKFNEICKNNRSEFVPPVIAGSVIADYTEYIHCFFNEALRSDTGLNIIQVFEILRYHSEILSVKNRNIFKTDSDLYILVAWSGRGWYTDLFSERWTVSKGDKIFGCARA